MNWKVMLVGGIFLLPQLSPFLLGHHLGPFAAEDKIKGVGEEAKELAPTGRAVETIEKAEKFSLGLVETLKKTSTIVGIILLLIGMFL